MVNENVDKLVARLEKIEKDKKIYNIVAIVLSILDVICGIISIVYASMLIASTVVSVLTGFVIGGKTIQIIKAERLARTIGVTLKTSWVRHIFLLCLAWTTARVKRGNSKMKKWLKANKWSVIAGFMACILIATAVFFAIEVYWLTAPLWAQIVITIASGVVACIPVYFLGAEKTSQYALRIATKVLPKEKVDELTENAKKIQSTIEAEKQKEIDAQKKLEELEKAKAVVAEYENAKKLIETNG